MTITHGVLSLSFVRNRGQRVTSPTTRQVAAPAAPAATGGLTCAPWEGLYLETAEAHDFQESPVPNPELERFLYTLMYGE
ncbi:hypothetical protein M1D93_20635 (plasmid) [Arthrobacter sp. Z1-9]